MIREMNTDDYKLLGIVTDATIRFLYCSDREKFKKTFGEESGDYLWGKFVDYYKANEGSFICYLDSSNKALLAKAVVESLRSSK